MREILFRGKRIDNGEWVYGAFSMKDCDSPFGEMLDRPSIIKYEDPFSGFWFRVDPDTVGQFTGLTDKNGKRVFEGDVMEFEAYGILYRGVVTIDGGNTCVFCKGGSPFLDDAIKRHDAVKIGNIHDNPELLEVE